MQKRDHLAVFNTASATRIGRCSSTTRCLCTMSLCNLPFVLIQLHCLHIVISRLPFVHSASPASIMQASAPQQIPAPAMYAPQAPQAAQPVQVVVVNAQPVERNTNSPIKCCQKPTGCKHQCLAFNLLYNACMIASNACVAAAVRGGGMHLVHFSLS
jgi:hypothetical protein